MQIFIKKKLVKILIFLAKHNILLSSNRLCGVGLQSSVWS